METLAKVEWYPQDMSWNEVTQHPNFPLWILLIGLAFAGLAIFLLWRKANFFKHSQMVIASEVAFNKRSALEGNLWQTIVKYIDTNNKEHKLDYTSSGAYPLFAKMNKVKVYYDPGNPKKAYAYTFWKVWSRELALSSFALLLILIGAGNLYFG